MEWQYLGKDALPPGTFAPKQVETWRAKVPGGWLVMVIETQQSNALGTTFYPDPQHEWDGNTLP